jgi:hypothetical protein
VGEHKNKPCVQQLYVKSCEQLAKHDFTLGKYLKLEPEPEPELEPEKNFWQAGVGAAQKSTKFAKMEDKLFFHLKHFFAVSLDSDCYISEEPCTNVPARLNDLPSIHFLKISVFFCFFGGYGCYVH